ncbi:unnamed protein product [Linum trigynum]|uniref:Uncharacterized protein n=1 Tax=Linum trigynum TaxID=586398 RepID=A0AAV2G0L5_9ROSI
MRFTFSTLPIQTPKFECYAGCVRRITLRETIEGCLKKFDFVIQDVCGEKAIVRHYGYDIGEFLENAPAAEQCMPLIVKITSLMRVALTNDHKYQYEFESTPASRLCEDVMDIFVQCRKPVWYIDEKKLVASAPIAHQRKLWQKSRSNSMANQKDKRPFIDASSTSRRLCIERACAVQLQNDQICIINWQSNVIKVQSKLMLCSNMKQSSR